MAGWSLHIGVNQIDSLHYGNSINPLIACLADANAMAQLAQKKEFSPKVLHDDDATRQNILGEIEFISAQAIAGDLVLITYSGHGSQIPVLPGTTDEEDGYDETWCVFDTQLIDSEIYQLLPKFDKGVRVVFLLDSCHSGTAIHEWVHESWDMLDHFTTGKNMRYRFMKESERENLYRKHKLDYQKRQQNILNSPKEEITAAVCLISACQDNQRAIEDTFNGMFTQSILRESGEKHSYRSMHKAIHKHLHAFQSPNLYTLGIGTKALLKEPFLQL